VAEDSVVPEFLQRAIGHRKLHTAPANVLRVSVGMHEIVVRRESTRGHRWVAVAVVCLGFATAGAIVDPLKEKDEIGDALVCLVGHFLDGRDGR
jgi:hypothetical protein